MNLYEYQRSRSFIDLGPRLLRFIIFSLETARPIEAKFHLYSHGMEEQKFIQMVQVTSLIWPPSCPYIVKKKLKIFFSGTKRPMILKVSMQH